MLNDTEPPVPFHLICKNKIYAYIILVYDILDACCHVEDKFMQVVAKYSAMHGKHLCTLY